MKSSSRQLAIFVRAISPVSALILAIISLASLQAGEPLTLDAAIRRALEKSPELAAARADLERARGEQIVADQPLPSNPELELSAVQGNRRISPSPSFSPQAYLNGSDPLDASVNALTGQNRQGISGYEVGLSQALDVSGKRGIRKSGAEATVQQASARYEQMRIATIAAVREAYISLQSLRKLRIQMEGRLAHLAWIQRNKGQFIDPRLGRYAANAFQNDLIAFRASYRDIQRREADAETGLRALLILPADESVALTDASAQAYPSPPTKEDAMKFAMSGLDVQMARSALEQAKANVELAGLQNVPDPTLFALYGKQDVSSGGIFGPDHEAEKTLRLGLRFTLPVANSAEGEQKIAKAELDRSAAQQDRLQATIKASVSSARQRYIRALEDYRASAGAVGATQAYLANMDQAFLSGRISYFDFWSEYDRSNQAMIRYADAAIEAVRACGELELRMGRSLARGYEKGATQ